MSTREPLGLPQPGPGAPTRPIPLPDPEAVTVHLGDAVPLPGGLVDRLAGVCATVTTDAAERAEAGRDWWPLAMGWAVENRVAALAGVVCRPTEPAEVASILRICNEARVPVTAAAGRSGVLGGSVPLHGGVLLDLCGLSGIRAVDDTSLVVDVLPGTFGDRFETELRTTHGLTCGHWPQSMNLSTVGGWIACRGAGQLSTRYGKIEDMVVGLDVVLADGTTIHTGGHPRQAAGPELTQLFVGSEGTLGVITGARLRVHPAPVAARRGAWALPSFADGLDVARRILRRGATPAVLRLYDPVESDRNYHTGGERSVVIVIDEGDPVLVDATFAVVEAELAATGAEALGDEVVDHWLAKRNDVSALEALVSRGYVVDTMEVSGPWSVLPEVYRAVVGAISAVPGTLAASAHCSHSYTDGACLYFTFAGALGEDAAAATTEQRDAYHRAVWDAGALAALDAGASLSHHHGVGLHRSPYMARAHGNALRVLASVKATLDPHGILNPGKLGLHDPWAAS